MRLLDRHGYNINLPPFLGRKFRLVKKCTQQCILVMSIAKLSPPFIRPSMNLSHEEFLVVGFYCSTVLLKSGLSIQMQGMQ